MKVKCIDNRPRPSSSKQELVEGEIYVVERESNTSFFFKGGWWYKTRFEVVPDNATVANATSTAAPNSSVSAKDDVDQEEERLRKILTSRGNPNDCKCGILRSQCTYHK